MKGLTGSVTGTIVLTASVGLGTTLYPKSVLYWFSVVVVVAVS